MIRQTSRAALVAAFMLSLNGAPVFAQTATEGSDTAEPAETATESTAESTTGATAAAETQETAPEPIAYDAETVIATANGIEVTLGELIAMRQGLPEQYQNLPGEVLMTALTDQVTTQALLADSARKAGLAERRDIRLRLQAQADAMLAESYIRDQVTKRVTEDAIEAAYQERFVNAPPTEERHASHILVETEEEAKELKKQLDEGADFAALAAEHGTDGTAQRGGDLGWFGKADMVPEFADAAFALEPGQLSDPIESSFGWHLIQLRDTREAVVPPIEEVYSQLLTMLAEEAQRDVVEQAMEGAEIVKSDPQVPGDAIKNDALLEPSE